MFRLPDLYTHLLKKSLATDCGIAVEPLNSQIAVLNRLLVDRVSFFSVNLISSGNATILYGGNRIELGRNDLFITAPGIRIYTENVSDDYCGICLIVEEDVMYDLPYAKNIISASYHLAIPASNNKLTLPDEDFKRLLDRIKDMQVYISESNPYKTECLYSLYSVFSLDLLNIETRLADYHGLSNASSALFIRFLNLMRENFIEHHEIEFYAAALAITPIYLSRIVKSISGQTVKNHIDRHLMMEAKHLLVNTNYPITRIGELLKFATPAGFCKFFLRHQGISSRDYRLANQKKYATRQNGFCTLFLKKKLAFLSYCDGRGVARQQYGVGGQCQYLVND